jgi:signal peptidase I
MQRKSTIRIVLEPLAVAIVLAALFRSACRLYAIPSASMSPTLAPGDHILVVPYVFSHHPERGDVIVFRSPRDQDQLLVKRIVGLPGDLIDSRSGRLRLGAHTVSEPYLASPAETSAIDSQIVPASSYYVLGDNRGNSYDSRHWGSLPGDLIVGRARLVLWSSELRAGEPASAQSPPQVMSPGQSASLRGRRLFLAIR